MRYIQDLQQLSKKIVDEQAQNVIKKHMQEPEVISRLLTTDHEILTRMIIETDSEDRARFIEKCGKNKEQKNRIARLIEIHREFELEHPSIIILKNSTMLVSGRKPVLPKGTSVTDFWESYKLDSVPSDSISMLEYLESYQPKLADLPEGNLSTSLPIYPQNSMLQNFSESIITRSWCSSENSTECAACSYENPFCDIDMSFRYTEKFSAEKLYQMFLLCFVIIWSLQILNRINWETINLRPLVIFLGRALRNSFEEIGRWIRNAMVTLSRLFAGEIRVEVQVFIW